MGRRKGVKEIKIIMKGREGKEMSNLLPTPAEVIAAQRANILEQQKINRDLMIRISILERLLSQALRLLKEARHD